MLLSWHGEHDAFGCCCFQISTYTPRYLSLDTVLEMWSFLRLFFSAAQNRCDVNVLERLSWCRDAQENDFLIEGSSDLWKVLVGVNKKVVLGCQPYCARILYYRIEFEAMLHAPDGWSYATEIMHLPTAVGK